MECGSCGGKHERLLVRKYITPQGPYTNWYTCPVTGDAVPVSLISLSRAMSVEVTNVVLRQLVRAIMSGSFLVVVWRVFDDPKPNNPLHKTLEMFAPTWQQFPTDDFATALGQLEERLSTQLGKPIRSAVGLARPAPAGQKLPPAVMLFDEKGKAAGDKSA
jgi:hypothetical protein